jgi:O-antigen/teichoic acid export membrane protein
LAEGENIIGLSQNVARIGKLGAIYVFGQIVPLLVGIFVLPIFTYYLVPEQMGIVTLARQFMNPLGILMQLGLIHSMASHYFRVKESEQPQLVKTALAGLCVQMFIFCSVLSIAGIWIASTLLPNLPLSTKHVYVLWLIIVWVCFFAALVGAGARLAQLNERAITSVSITLTNLLLRAGLGVFAIVVLGWQGLGRFGTIFIGTAIASIYSVWTLSRFIRDRFNFSLFKRLLQTGLTFVPHSFSGILALSLNAWLLNKLVSTSALGIYGIAVLFGRLLQLPLTAFGDAAYPTLAKLMSDGGNEAKRQHSRLYTVLIVGISILALTISLFSPIAIKILTAPQYHEAIHVVPILVFAWLIHGLYWVASNPVFYFGKGLWMACATGASVVVSVILNIILAPVYGIYGTAFAMVGCFFVRFVVISVISNRLYPLPWEYSAILRAVGAALLLGLVDYWFGPQLSLAWSTMLKVLLLSSFIPLLLLTGVIKKQELVWVKNLIITKIQSFRR